MHNFSDRDSNATTPPSVVTQVHRGFVLALLLVLGAVPEARSDTLAGKADIKFTGSSTLHEFEGKAPPVAFAPSDDAAGNWSARVQVPVASLDTGNGWRDSNMRKVLDAEHYPSILAAFDGIAPDALRQHATLPFMLTIRDKARPVTAALTNWKESEQHLEFDAAFSVSLADYGLEVPSVLFVHVDDKVAVTVHVSLDR